MRTPHASAIELRVVRCESILINNEQETCESPLSILECSFYFLHQVQNQGSSDSDIQRLDRGAVLWDVHKPVTAILLHIT